MAEGFPFSAAGEMEDRSLPKADVLERFLAKLIDALIVGALFAFPTFVGVLAGLTYILISDGLKDGRSIGKRIIGLKVVFLSAEGETPCDFKQSIIRNSPFALIIVWYMVVGWIPYLGKILGVAGALAVAGIEMALIYTDERGSRFGDRIANTQVVPEKPVKLP